MRDLTYDLVEEIFKVSRLMRDELSFERDLKHLSPLQFHTLIFLSQHQEAIMSDIAGYFHIELPSATSLITKMSQQNLVTRHTHPEDRRLVMISLTDEGKAILNKAKEQRRKKLEHHLSYLSDQEKLNLLSILQTLQNRLQK